MAVNHEVRPVAGIFSRPWRFGDDDGMAVSRADFCVKADLPAMLRQPIGAGVQILFVLRLGGDAGEAQEFAQLGHEAGLVAFEVIENQLHGDQLNGARWIFQ